MRPTTFHTALTTAFWATVFLATAGLPGLALAQSNPSAQQLINQLKPAGTLSSTTRGIKPLPPGRTPPAAASTTAPAAAMAPGSPMAPASSMSPTNATAAMNAPAPRAPASRTAPATPPSANLDVEFASGSAALTPKAIAALDQLGKALTSPELASYNFKIVGHTDTTGSAAINQTLSEQRAAAVKSYLETKFNVASTRLQSEGVGESDLAVNTPPNTPNKQNRRVQIINLGQ